MNEMRNSNSPSIVATCNHPPSLVDEKATLSSKGTHVCNAQSDQIDKKKAPLHRQKEQSQQQQPQSPRMTRTNSDGNNSTGASSSSSSPGESTRNLLRRGNKWYRRGSSLRLHLTHILLITTLWIVAVSMSLGVYKYLANDQRAEFKRVFASYSHDILTGFQDAVEKKLNAIDTLATSVTETSLMTNQTFPFVSIPDFETRGSTVRVLSDALMILWLPLVTDETRQKWEEYALANRKEVIDGSYFVDSQQRQKQDEEFGFFDSSTAAEPENQGGREGQRRLRGRRRIDRTLQDDAPHPPPQDLNVVPDGTGYHKRIFDVLDGSVLTNGTGPFLPVWQQTPVTARSQAILNLDFNRAPALGGVLPMMMEDPSKAILHRVFFPTTTGEKQMQASLSVGQYRHDTHTEEYLNDPISFMAYPVFDSLDIDNRQFVGVLAVNLYWRLYFAGILPSSAEPIICVLSNSYNQTFAYHIDGTTASFIGRGDPHNKKYDRDPDFEVNVNVNEYIANRASPDKRGYTTASLHQMYGQTFLSIYPSSEMEDTYLTDQPITYALLVGVCFLVLSLTIVYMFSRALAQHSNARTEKDLTAYVAHELRNPLGAMDSALYSMPDDSPADVLELVSSMRVCSAFMIRLMNNLLDARQLEEGKMELHPHPTSLSEVMDHVCQMMRPSVRDGVALVHRCDTTTLEAIDTPIKSSLAPNETSEMAQPSLGDWVECDKDRFQQVLINVVSNAIKYTTSGSITLSFQWEDNSMMLSTLQKKSNDRILVFICKDTGPGIPKKLQSKMFHRFVGRGGAPGSGLGLAISKLIVERMGGTIQFHSDPSVKPGTTCIVRVPMQLYEGPEQFLATNSNTCEDEPLVSKQFQVVETEGSNDKSSEMMLAPAAPKPSSSPRIMEELSILVVDDIKMNRAMLKRRFIKCIAPNCVVSEASTGEEAIKSLLSSAQDEMKIGRNVHGAASHAATMTQQQQEQQQRGKNFDVIIVDQYMEEAGGVMLGTDAVYAMRRSGINSLIIGCSGNAVAKEFADAGANLFWDKPLPSNPQIIQQLRDGLRIGRIG